MMKRLMKTSLFLFLAAVLFAGGDNRLAAADVWKAGVAKTSITPEEPMWMAGYSNRPLPASEKLHDLWAKALVLEDPQGNRAVLVTLDAHGIDRRFSLRLRDQLKALHGLEKRQIAICSSHTHSGPVTNDRFHFVFGLTPQYDALRLKYLESLHKKIVQIVGEALKQTAPCTLQWGTGTATFAFNRRNNAQGAVPQLREKGQLRGPSDYDAPVLSVRGADGKLVAVAFGYACHATALGPSNQKWSADYAGFAEDFIEAANPGCTALFWAGCGGDQNPGPRDSQEWAEKHGRELADAVADVLSEKTEKMKTVRGELRTAYVEVEAPFESTPSREQLEREAAATGEIGLARRARYLLHQIEAGFPIRSTYSYPVQTWRIGAELLFVTLGGEAVVDYALNIKQQFGPERTFVASYANDVMAYIPSQRVHREGGYEGRTGFMIYGLPAPWGPQIEPLILHAVARQVELLTPTPRKSVDPFTINFEDAGGMLPTDQWYVGGGMSATRLRLNQLTYKRSWSLSSAGDPGEPPTPINVYSAGIDNATSIAWGPVFRVGATKANGARIGFVISGGSRAWTDGATDGPSGLALWDVDARDFVRYDSGGVAYASAVRNAFAFQSGSLSLEGLGGRRLCLALVDRASGGWGWNSVDDVALPKRSIELSDQLHHRVTVIADFDDDDSLAAWTGDVARFQLGNGKSASGRTPLHVNQRVRPASRDFPREGGYLSSRQENRREAAGAVESRPFKLTGHIVEFYVAGSGSGGVLELVSESGERLAAVRPASGLFAYGFWRIDPKWNGTTARLRVASRSPSGYIEVDALRMVEFDAPHDRTETEDQPTPADPADDPSR